jgi:hypothetical protein
VSPSRDSVSDEIQSVGEAAAEFTFSETFSEVHCVESQDSTCHAPFLRGHSLSHSFLLPTPPTLHPLVLPASPPHHT